MVSSVGGAGSTSSLLSLLGGDSSGGNNDPTGQYSALATDASSGNAAASTLASAQGNLMQGQMAASGNANNMAQQQSSLAQKQAQTDRANQAEQDSYKTMADEKIMNLNRDAIKQSMDNTWQFAKTCVNSMKY